MDLRIVLFSLVWMAGALAYPNGPPPEACQSMFPTGHNAVAQSGAAPYTIDLNNALNYRNNVTVTLSADDGEYFEGVFVQVRPLSCEKTDQSAVGTYALDNTNAVNRLKTLDCFTTKDALSHKDKVKKKVLQFTWIPPSQNLGALQFRATFVKETEQFWTDVTSQVIVFSPEEKLEVCVNNGGGRLNVRVQAYFAAMCALLSLFIFCPR